MSSFQGHFLVATPTLFDPNFRQSVILIIQHSADGAMGVILNRPTQIRADQAWEEISSQPCEHEDLLYFGGPCQQSLSALHTESTLADIPVMDGLYHSLSQAMVEKTLTRPLSPVRFFVGYAGWSPGQLENEWEAGGWMKLPATLADVFEKPEGFWEKMTRRIAVNMLRAPQA